MNTVRYTASSERYMSEMCMCSKKSGYITEVHHIDGDGEDAGVVYCEMQSRENSGESRVHLALLRAMYPGNCGYRYETGGIMHNLRVSTSHVKVCVCVCVTSLYLRLFVHPDSGMEHYEHVCLFLGRYICI